MKPPAALPGAPVTPLDLFLALVAIGSPSGAEGRLADAVVAWLSAIDGVECSRDDAAALTGSDTGNVIARRFVAGDRPTVLYVAHLDTVQSPQDAIVPVVDEDGVVHSSGETILGADNKSAVAALLTLLARPRPEHANLVAVFTTCEERGRMGVTALGDLADEVDYAFPVDGSSPIGTVLEAGLGQVPFELTLRGRRAHAAKAYDAGANAVQAACEIVAGLQLGWVGESVMNVSAVGGGTETNVVPDLAVIRGEVRAFAPAPLEARLGLVRERAAAVAQDRGVSWDLVELSDAGAPPFPPSGAAANLEIVSRALDGLGIPLRRERCMATLEANFLHAMGMSTLGIASGGEGPHSVDESLAVAELERLVTVLDAVLTETAASDI